jgi:hypothetical protein
MRKEKPASSSSAPSRFTGRVLARVVSEDIRNVNGGDNYPPIYLPTSKVDDTTASEAATSESLPDQ